jgi:hypothetical protein
MPSLAFTLLMDPPDEDATDAEASKDSKAIATMPDASRNSVSFLYSLLLLRFFCWVMVLGG